MTSPRERAGFAVGLVVALIVFAMLALGVPDQGGHRDPLARAGGAVLGDANPEAGEQAEGTELRHQALEAALDNGTAGQSGPRTYLTAAAPAASTAWVGEVPADPTADDWEPAVAADPSAPYVYVLTTRYGGKPCPGNCPSPFIALLISTDGGATFGPAKPLCACKGSGQFDPIIEVVPGTGAVYALYLNGFNVMFVKSTNHGATWSAPVKTYGNVSWTDKPIIAVSDDGRDVYASFNGPTGGDPYVAQSHDFGATWTQTKVVDSARYIFAFDGDVASDGTVYFAETSLLYGGGGNKGSYPSGAIEEHVFVSTDRGASWQDRLVASVQPGITCVAAGCTPDFYLGHSAISADATGALVLLYDGATTTGGSQLIYAQRSTDRGVHWSAATVLSTSGEEAVDPMVESRGTGDVRVAWSETSGGGNVDAWNTWSRRSTDGGATWSAPVRISDATSGAAYKTAAGYAEVYGDYGEIAITSAGKSIAAWGEGTSYTGPGGVWINREP
jgi:hypothetical protein